MVALTTEVSLAAARGYTGRIEERSMVCTAHDVMRVAEGPEYLYRGKTYYFCYPRCLDQFKRAPERLSQATDPVSGESVDKAKGFTFLSSLPNQAAVTRTTHPTRAVGQS